MADRESPRVVVDWEGLCSGGELASPIPMTQVSPDTVGDNGCLQREESIQLLKKYYTLFTLDAMMLFNNLAGIL